MRLNQIKLAGFKSFAEPTTFQLPGQRVGVVGPNGCGKSNIIDAVRWVLGESKASELRGESMQDVIFNGSGQRKPAGRASVELVFDNTLARAGGQWNTFAEIAVKRVLTRDGTSSYYINNQPVRRRDVQDVFLGTGLGPRAYAIIGQGTISRIIESRPEELRLFLEEAAGVSKYKERRRETENRLKDTRENLTRVDDILRELNSNLDKLEKQAEVAARYRELQDNGTLKLHQLWFLKHRDAASEEARVQAAVSEASTALEARLAELRHTEAELETVRQAHYAASDALHVRQGELGQAQLEVSRLEERIRFVVEGRKRAEARLVELQAQNAQWLERAREAEAEAESLAALQESGAEQAEILQAQAAEQGEALPALDDALRQAQATANQQRGRVAEVQQQIQVLAAESRNVDEQSRGLKTRRDRLMAEKAGLAAPCATWPRRGWTTCRSRYRNSTSVAATRRPRRRPKPPRPVTSRPGWTHCAPCRKRCRPKASSSPGWPSMGWTACPGCGSSCTSSPAGRPPSKRHCASGSTRWRLAASTSSGRLPTTCRRPNSRSTRHRMRHHRRRRRTPTARCRAWPTSCVCRMPVLRPC